MKSSFFFCFFFLLADQFLSSRDTSRQSAEMNEQVWLLVTICAVKTHCYKHWWKYSSSLSSATVKVSPTYFPLLLFMFTPGLGAFCYCDHFNSTNFDLYFLLFLIFICFLSKLMWVVDWQQWETAQLGNNKG